MGALAAAPGSASAIAAPQDLGTKAASLLPAAPVKHGFAVTARVAITTTTTLTVSQNPARRGNPVTLTATVAGTGTNILPTGNVVFRDGTRDLGTVPLEGAGRATLTVLLDEGTHNITATYVGNTSFATSTSSTAVRVDGDDMKKEEDKKKEEWWHKKKEDDWKKHQEEEKKKAEPKKAKEVKKQDDVQDDENDDDGDDEKFTDHNRDDEDLGHRCRRFKHNFEDDQDSSSGDNMNRQDRDDLRRRCEKWWHHHNRDFTTLIDRGIRRHVEGFYDAGGGHHSNSSHWDARRNRWVPEHEHHYEKPHQVKKHYHKPVHRPVQHFAVTG
ncbi:Ig-like domain-containing protein [Sphaerisporangium perillae]|uniref:Ig-like domain-containing protein n=1 Tax=Sphaerisporangium perillae TaxID=2935860 RepID=UPI00200C70A0|nr:Ig-like domain-containing protein [Sphaerisporangium perillae]